MSVEISLLIVQKQPELSNIEELLILKRHVRGTASCIDTGMNHPNPSLKLPFQFVYAVVCT
jgi:hypothetical protein